jgi:hypothetical protein
VTKEERRGLIGDADLFRVIMFLAEYVHDEHYDAQDRLRAAEAVRDLLEWDVGP